MGRRPPAWPGLGGALPASGQGRPRPIPGPGPGRRRPPSACRLLACCDSTAAGPARPASLLILYVYNYNYDKKALYQAGGMNLISDFFSLVQFFQMGGHFLRLSVMSKLAATQHIKREHRQQSNDSKLLAAQLVDFLVTNDTRDKRRSDWKIMYAHSIFIIHLLQGVVEPASGFGRRGVSSRRV